MVADADDHAHRMYLPGGNGEVFRHAHGCTVCRADLDRRRKSESDALQREREGYTTAALARADRLLAGDALVLVKHAGNHCGNGDRYELATDAPLPQWLCIALQAAELSRLDVYFPTFLRCEGPLNWPTLVRQHPEELVVAEELLAANDASNWAGIAESHAYLLKRGHQPVFDVMLAVDELDRISLEPMGLWTRDPVREADPDVVRVDEILTGAGGYAERFALVNESGERWWLLT